MTASGFVSGSLRVEIREVDDPFHEGEVAVSAVLDLPDAGYPFNASEIGASLRAALGTPPPPHTLDTTHSIVSWGASGDGLNLTLLLAAGMVESAAWDGLKAVLRSIVQAARGAGGIRGAPLKRKEAEQRARWWVEATYSVEADRLRLVGEGERVRASGPAFSFTFRANEGEFTVEVIDQYGLALVASHSHRLRDG